MRLGAMIALAALAALGGCYESSTPLGPPERVMAEPAFLGAWRCTRPDKEVVAVEILAFDASRYYAESRLHGETGRYAAYGSVVGGSLLYNVRPLGQDKWFFVRAASPSDAELVLSIVKKDELKDLDEPAALREIRRRANDDALYERWAACRRP